MECVWRLYSHWRKAGNRYQQNPSIFYLHFSADDGFSHNYLYGTGFLEKYEEVYLGGEAESVVLFVKNIFVPAQRTNQQGKE
jgi:hypothetical protein